MTRTTRSSSSLVAALEESGRRIFETDTGRLYIRCPWTRWHADVLIKHAEIVLGIEGVSPDFLKCEICGQKSHGDVLRILDPWAVHRAVLRALGVVDPPAATDPEEDPS
ncbi:MAG: hypothetical protein IPO09_11685 [Anaeromyxobacter sp.]|nr:hypothetical protein [Anaeromyxobacter sp.]MBL0276253.1 hypothetical protein [Anaeromyxobacter sp.]